MGKIDLAYIIDDDEIIVYLTGKLIERVDFCERSETFTNGLQAIERLKEAKDNNEKLPDVILFDLNMPVMDGWEFLEAYLDLNLDRNIPLFVFTSSIHPQEMDKSLSYKEIKGYIQKPLTTTELEKILRIVT